MHFSDKISVLEVLWTVILGTGFIIKTFNFIDAHKDLKALKESGRNGFRMKLALGARDTDFLRAFAMFFLLVPGIISLFAKNPANADPVPWYTYFTISAFIVAGVFFTVVSIRARLTRKAVIEEALRVDEHLPVEEVHTALQARADEAATAAASDVLQIIETHTPIPDSDSE